MTRFPRRAAAVCGALLLTVLAASVVLGQEELLGGKLRVGDTLAVPAGETVDGDLYLLARTIAVDGTVTGDLTVLGGQIQLNGTVNGDVLVAGGSVSIGGTVDGDVRAAGGQVTAGGSIGEDLAATGGQLTLSAGGVVAEDMLVSGGQVTMAGSVAGRLEGSAGTYSRTGSVGGTENVAIAPREDPAERTQSAILDAVRQFVVIVLLGALLLWLAPHALGAAERTLRERPLVSFGGGLAAIVGYVVSVVVLVLLMVLLAILFGVLQIGALLAIELIAGILALGVISFLFVLAIAYLADVVVGFGLGRLVGFGSASSRWRQLVALAAGAALVVILTSLPILGGLLKLVVVLLGLGAIAVAALRAWRSRGGRRVTAQALTT